MPQRLFATTTKTIDNNNKRKKFLNRNIDMGTISSPSFVLTLVTMSALIIFLTTMIGVVFGQQSGQIQDNNAGNHKNETSSSNSNNNNYAASISLLTSINNNNKLNSNKQSGKCKFKNRLQLFK